MTPPDTSLVLATTYMVFEAGSITGVLVIPYSGEMSLQGMSPLGMVVTPAPGLMKLTCQSVLVRPSASKA